MHGFVSVRLSREEYMYARVCFSAALQRIICMHGFVSVRLSREEYMYARVCFSATLQKTRCAAARLF